MADAATLAALPETGRREKRKLEIRGRIQDAAYALFRERGIKDTSIEQICASADVARRTFYSHYPDKQALLRELSRSRVVSTAEGLVERMLAARMPTRERVSAMLDHIERNLADYSEIDRQLLLVTPASGEDDNHLRELSYSLQDQFRRVFQAGIDSGELRGRFSADILSEMVMGTFNNMMVQWALNPEFPLYRKLGEARELFGHVLSGS